MRRLCSVAALTALLVTVLQGTIPSAQAGAATTYYLALGDSLSVGHQPGMGRSTHEGYTDQLLGRLRQRAPGLALRNVGCPGETTRSLITGKRTLCHYAAGSQLDAAVTFLKAHPGATSFVTIDIGSNDLVGRCLDFRTGMFDPDCTADLIPRLRARLTHIVDALRSAAGPDVPIVGMKYYDPFVGLWALIPGGHAVARADQRAWAMLNTALTAAYVHSGVAVADVAETFKIRDFKDRVEVPGLGPVPVNVALVCKWTWFCSKYLGDPHANRTGYRKIAATFERKLEGLLS
ncbi:MAG: SGNH/GDSL hydrolase family protein [Actinomycetota bacterium]